MAPPGNVKIGHIVNCSDASGNIKAAIVANIQNSATGLIRATAFEAGATLTDVNNVAFDAHRSPNSWHWADGA